MPGQLDKNLKKAVKNIKVSDFSKIKEIEMDPEIVKIAKEMGKKIQKKEMGGEVIDMTKSQDVSMMDEGGSAISDSDRQRIKEMLGRGDPASVKKMIFQKKGMGMSESDVKRMEEMLGKVKTKKMNMGGVVPGRGGSFKGVR
tara:strand:- start:170 stop:595 length:426 start_codon:yes stop_codon:yes gene_type:complete